MKISRIDIIGQNGPDGAIYDEIICGDCWIEFGVIDCRCKEADRGGQNRLPDTPQVQGTDLGREAHARQGAAGGCAADCAGCSCGAAEGEGE